MDAVVSVKIRMIKKPYTERERDYPEIQDIAIRFLSIVLLLKSSQQIPEPVH